ncbi:MAG: tRNA uridine-5-carboxymethylaminomethyl(34) synthesis GTPase MnmE [Alphaproteobacteria bacterium]|nr:tRNA uridine-5-carboxymethylaminomethyl(34) synthesis GTPase MnmE [Alphaproteobacteria bacterium]
MTDDRTIFALASAPGRSGVALFRVSGKEALRAIEQLCSPAGKLAPRTAALRAIKNPHTNETIDRALVIAFKGPSSYTGEDSVEFHTHGGRAVVNAMTEALGSIPGFRLAEPGEFTRRAFENGKMDLTEAEAVADLVHAETEAQRKQALRQLDGALGKLYGNWHERLSHSLAMMEASIDFADEDLPQDLFEREAQELSGLRGEIARHLNDGHRGERLREGFSIVLLGPPNAGKSSLLNALARRDAAIVSPIAGTTRDVIEVYLDINGYPAILADTAGLKEATGDAIEREGMCRARARARDADLKIVVFDGANWPRFDPEARKLVDSETITVVNKSDLIENRAGELDESLFLSAKTGEGIEPLLTRLGREIAERFDDNAAPSLTRARHREALEECLNHLDRSLSAVQPDLRAEDVRLAMRALGRITGRVDVEDLLDNIFKDFCIGK